MRQFDNRLATVVRFVVLAVAFFIAGRSNLVLHIVLKVMPCLLLTLALCGELRRSGDGRTIRPALVALAFSMIGDVFGELDRTALGQAALMLQIGAFAVAQAFYISSFARHISLRKTGWGALTGAALLAAALVAFGFILIPRVESGALRVAVTLYMCLVSAMGLTALLQRREGYACFAAGGVLFIISDSLIGIGLFISTFPHRGLMVMLTYFAAQLLLNITLIKPNNHV